MLAVAGVASQRGKGAKGVAKDLKLRPGKVAARVQVSFLMVYGLLCVAISLRNGATPIAAALRPSNIFSTGLATRQAWPAIEMAGRSPRCIDCAWSTSFYPVTSSSGSLTPVSRNAVIC